MTRDADAAKPVRDLYGARIIAFLKRVQTAARALGYTFRQGPYEASDDEYRWELVGRRPGGGPEDLVDFSLSIAEAAAYGEEPADGVNFAFDMVGYGGQLLGGLTPYNYTPQVWVRVSDAAGLEARFRLIEKANLSTLATLL